MPSFTKRAIVESFLHIAAKKPLDKITVRDIVDDCGVNRNTFYYYFQDVYAVLEEICAAAFVHVPDGLALDQTLLFCFDVFLSFSKENPRVSRSLVISQGYEGLERYFAPELDRLISACLLRGRDIEPDAAFLKTVTAFVRHAYFGAVLTWMRDERNADAGQIKAALSRILRVVERGVLPGDGEEGVQEVTR